MLLDQINKPGDIRTVKPSDYKALAAEIRSFLVNKISARGGHLASNLGAVELTMALHLAFDPEKDKLIFDVGHQCYTHKILTGRKAEFDSLRCYGGLSGFPKKKESACDIFDTGHSSTSISMGMGLAKARDAAGENYAVVSVIGDGSMTGGMAFEALNNASRLGTGLIIVLNDNNMSISRNIGGMSRALQNLRTEPHYNQFKQNVKDKLDRIPDVGGKLVTGISRMKNSVKQLFLSGMIFEDMDLTYLGPIDGHNIPQMVDAFQDARRLNKPVVVHVVTKKGKGYRFAEEDPERFHGIGAFDIQTGKSTQKSEKTYTNYITEGLMELADRDERITAVTAAMGYGTGLTGFEKKYPKRFYDVGIAEQHAVSFAAGLSTGGMKPYVCIYSTFLQRAYDQILHDVCLQQADVKFLIDRAGIVGEDGETHQGMYDMGFLRTCPGLTLMAPRDGLELLDMLRFSREQQGPLAIRYPRGAATEALTEERSPIEFGRAEVLREGRSVLIFAAGSMVRTALAVSDRLNAAGLEPTVVNARFLQPLDGDLLEKYAESHKLCVVMNEACRNGGLGEAVESFTEEKQLDWRVLNTEPEECFIPQGKSDKLKEMLGLNAASLTRRILDTL